MQTIYITVGWKPEGRMAKEPNGASSEIAVIKIEYVRDKTYSARRNDVQVITAIGWPLHRPIIPSSGTGVFAKLRRSFKAKTGYRPQYLEEAIQVNIDDRYRLSLPAA